MLYHLLYPLHTRVSGFNVIRYITFRTAVASLTALFLVLILGPWMIERLRRLLVSASVFSNSWPPIVGSSAPAKCSTLSRTTSASMREGFMRQRK